MESGYSGADGFDTRDIKKMFDRYENSYTGGWNGTGT
jgi:hypothetical protein